MSVTGGPGPCRAPDRAVLDGGVLRLEPVDHPAPADVVDGLHRILADPAGGGFHPFQFPHTSRAQTEEFLAARAAGDGVTYVVRSTDERLAPVGEVLGTTTLMDVDVVNRKIHLGSTIYAREVRGGVVNPLCKLLVLDHVFTGCGFGRVRIQCDAANAPSRGAIAKLGARFEGVLRRDVLRADGTWRDTAVFAILADEWPACRVALEERVRAARPV